MEATRRQRKENNMTAGNHQFGVGATLAVVGGVALGATMFESKFGTILSRLYLSMVHIWAQWWPLLLIVAGMILLLRNQTSETRSHQAAQPRFRDAQGGGQ
jgi:hypothetical protein